MGGVSHHGATGIQTQVRGYAGVGLSTKSLRPESIDELTALLDKDIAVIEIKTTK